MTGIEIGIIAYGTSHHALVRNAGPVAERNTASRPITCGCGRTRSPRKSTTSSPAHKRVYVVDQNRDGQMFSC